MRYQLKRGIFQKICHLYVILLHKECKLKYFLLKKEIVNLTYTYIYLHSRTYSTMQNDNSTVQPEPTYSYLPTPSTPSTSRSQLNVLQATADKVVEQMATVLEMRKNEVAKSKHHHFLAHLGSIIELLPDSTANELGAKFLAMTYDELHKINYN